MDGEVIRFAVIPSSRTAQNGTPAEKPKRKGMTTNPTLQFRNELVFRVPLHVIYHQWLLTDIGTVIFNRHE